MVLATLSSFLFSLYFSVYILFFVCLVFKGKMQAGIKTLTKPLLFFPSLFFYVPIFPYIYGCSINIHATEVPKNKNNKSDPLGIAIIKFTLYQ